MIKVLILLGGGIESIPIIQRVKELGFRAVVVDGNPNAPGMAVADEALTASCYHSTEILSVLDVVNQVSEVIDRKMLKQYRKGAVVPDGILCVAIDAPLACAEVAEAFGLPGLSVEAARLSQDKLNQKHILRSCSIPVPQSVAWDGDDDNLPIWADVVKPVDSRGGRGVIRLLLSAGPSWAYEQARSYSSTGRVMAEQWLDGPQLSTESIIQDGRVMFTAVGLRNYARLDEFAPYVVEDGFDEPFGSDDEDIEIVISELIEQACRALGWYQSGAGTVKGDLVIHDGRVYVIELAARLSGGFFASHGHPLAYGVDFVGAAIRAALGYTLEAPKPYARGYVSQRYVFPSLGDIGKTIYARAIPETVFMPISELFFNTWNIKPGDVVHPITCHPDRWGQALLWGRTPNEARVKAEAAVAAMKHGVVVR